MSHNKVSMNPTIFVLYSVREGLFKWVFREINLKLVRICIFSTYSIYQKILNPFYKASYYMKWAKTSLQYLYTDTSTDYI